MGTINSRPPSSSWSHFIENKIVKPIQDFSLYSPSLKKYVARFNRYFFGHEMIFLDIDGTVLSWTDTYKRLQGYSEKEILGQKVSIFYMPLDRELHLPEKLISEAEKKGSAVHSGKWVRKDGTTFIGRMVIRAIRSLSNNELLGFSEVLYKLDEETE